MSNDKFSWNDTNTDRAIGVYTAAGNDTERLNAVAALAAELGTTPASVRGKLVASGVYVKPDTAAPNKRGGLKKGDLVSRMVDVAMLPADDKRDADLEKLTRQTIITLTDRFAMFRAESEDDPNAADPDSVESEDQPPENEPAH